MENIPSPGLETFKEQENIDSLPLPPSLESDDDLVIYDEFSDDKAFLHEESILMEGDYRTSEMGNIYEDDAISLPSEDSLYHLDEYFTLRTIHHLKKHY